jgi:hypothetical protein
MSAKDGIVHLWSLPEDKIGVRLKNVIQKDMIEKALSIVGTKKRLAEILNINRRTFIDFTNNKLKSTSFTLVKRLSEFLIKNGFKDFSIENLEMQIEAIKMRLAGNEILCPRFPIDFNSKEGVQIIAAILCDGGIKKPLCPFYTNKEKLLKKRLIDNLEKVVGKMNYRESNNELVFPRILGEILATLGLVPGRKVLTNPSIPSFILGAEEKIKKAFLQQVFDDEGTVSKTAIQLGQSHYKTEPPLRLVQIKMLIEGLGSRVSGPYGPYEYKTKRGHSRYAWYIQITNRTDIREFTKKIDFSLERKRNALDLLNLPISKNMFKRGTISNEVLKVCYELKQEGKSITNKNIAKRLGRTPGYISEIASKLLEKGKLEIIRERGRPGKLKSSWDREFSLRG